MPNQNAVPLRKPSTGKNAASPGIQLRRQASSVVRYALASPVTHPAISCQAKPADHGQGAERHDVHDLARAQRLPPARDPPPDAEHAQEQREGEHPRPGEGHERDERVQPRVPAPHDAPQGEEEPQQEQRLRVAELEERRQRARREERDRPHRRRSVHPLPHHPVEDEGCRVPGHHGHDERADHPLTAERLRDPLRQVGVHGHERPRVLAHGAAVGQRKRRRIARFRDDPVPPGVPAEDQVAETRLRAEARGEPRQLPRDQQEDRRDDARGEVHDAHPDSGGDPGPGAVLRLFGDQRVDSHARRPCSTASICASGTRSSSWCASCGSPGP